MKHMKTALELEGIVSAPDVILAKKYARLRLLCAPIADSAMAAGGIRRRNSLLQIDSEDLVGRP